MINTVWRTQQHDFMPFSAVQTILLFASLTLGWSIVRRLYPSPNTEKDSFADIALAAFASASAMSALMILLSQWETKGECLAVIAFSSCLSAMVAYWMAPLRSSLCFWLSPLAVAAFGYICAAQYPRHSRRDAPVLARPFRWTMWAWDRSAPCSASGSHEAPVGSLCQRRSLSNNAIRNPRWFTTTTEPRMGINRIYKSMLQERVCDLV